MGGLGFAMLCRDGLKVPSGKQQLLEEEPQGAIRSSAYNIRADEDHG